LPDPKIVAMYRIQNEGRWIEKSIDSILDICSKIIILDDNSTDDTLEICQSFDKVNVIHQDNLPLDQVRDKNKLLKIVLKQNPDYVLSLDGDEILTPHSKEILFEEINVLYPENSVFTFQVPGPLIPHRITTIPLSRSTGLDVNIATLGVFPHAASQCKMEKNENLKLLSSNIVGGLGTRGVSIYYRQDRY
jgi:glycosyltransferase involved in cell wall biosynthesis